MGEEDRLPPDSRERQHRHPRGVAPLEKEDSFGRVVLAPDSQMEMTTAELHYHLGMYVIECESPQQLPSSSIYGTGCSYAVPVRASSPGDN